MVCQLFSPYGEKEAVLFGCFLQNVLQYTATAEGKSKALFKKIFENCSSAIRRNAGRFDQCFLNFFSVLRYTEKNMLF